MMDIIVAKLYDEIRNNIKCFFLVLQLMMFCNAFLFQVVSKDCHLYEATFVFTSI